MWSPLCFVGLRIRFHSFKPNEYQEFQVYLYYKSVGHEVTVNANDESEEIGEFKDLAMLKVRLKNALGKRQEKNKLISLTTVLDEFFRFLMNNSRLCKPYVKPRLTSSRNLQRQKNVFVSKKLLKRVA